MLEFPPEPKELTEEQVDLFKRRGSFVIANGLLHLCSEEVMIVLSNVLIIKAENDFMSDSITYHGYSKYFDTLDGSVMEAKYEWTLHQSDDGTTKIEKCERQHFTEPANIERILERLNEELRHISKE